MQSLCHGTITKSTFEAPTWARNRHIQTIWPRFFQRRMPLKYRMERQELPDGDFIDLAFGPTPKKLSAVVVLFHGLEGSIRSHYANDMMAVLSRNGWQAVLMHFRGCSGEPNRTPRAYHSGDTEDAIWTLNALKKRFADVPMGAVGFSLGGNMLLKLLGENPAQHWLKAAVSVSAPLKLAECARSISKGFSNNYQRYLLNSMKQTLKQKMLRLDYRKLLQIGAADVDNIASFREFDEQVTAPLHGFADADDYYERCSAFHYLSSIHCNTLLLHAIDDPFMNHLVVPAEQDLAHSVQLELSETGGHVGFMQGSWRNPKIWLHQRVPDFLRQHLPTIQGLDK